MRLAKANSLSEPRSLNLIYEGGITPEGATLKSVDGYSLLRYRGPGLVDRPEILGFLLNSERMILGAAMTEQDDHGIPDDSCAMGRHELARL
jgi:hypothetical protein